jgi:hypothetical protein
LGFETKDLSKTVAEKRAGKRATEQFGESFVNEAGDLVQRDLVTGKISKISTMKDDGSGKPDPAKIAKAEQDMRRDFTKLTNEFQGLKKRYLDVISAAEDPSAAGDIAMIFAFMKILDPTSVVREGEQATAANARGVPESIRTLNNRVISGEKLGENQRADFVDRATRLMEAQTQSHLQSEEVFRGLATRNSLDPENVVLDFLGGDMREFFTRRGREITQVDINRTREELEASGESATPADVKRVLLSEGMVPPEAE